MSDDRPAPPRAGAIILSAGASRRMGRPKALLPCPPVPDPLDDAEAATDGPAATFLGRIAHRCRQAGAEPVVAVLGPPHGALIRAAFAAAPRSPAWAENPRPEDGMLSSAQAGVRALPPGLAGALLWPVDMPLVALATLRRLLSAARDGAGATQLVVPTYQERAGHPLWLPAGLFPALLALPPDSPGGLRQLRQAHPPLRLAVTDEGVLRDFDSEAELPPSRG